MWHKPISGVRSEGRQEVVSPLPAVPMAGLFPVGLFPAEETKLGKVVFGKKVKTGNYSRPS